MKLLKKLCGFIDINLLILVPHELKRQGYGIIVEMRKQWPGYLFVGASW